MSAVIDTTSTEGLLPARVPEPTTPAPTNYLPAAGEWRTIERMADVLAESSLVPKAYYRKPANIILATLAGRPFGWDPTMSMRSFHIIEGTPSLKPEILLALVRAAGHSVTGEVSSEGATCTGIRKDTGDSMTATFTMDDARRAGLAGKDVWKKYPADMCWARALSAVCRRMFSDVTLGVAYTPEELGADDDPIETTASASPVDDWADDEEVARMVERLGFLPTKEARVVAKHEFVQQFGRPDELLASQVGAAWDLIRRHENAVTTAPDPLALEPVCSECSDPLNAEPSTKVDGMHDSCADELTADAADDVDDPF